MLTRMMIGAKRHIPQRKKRREVPIHMLILKRMMNPMILRTRHHSRKPTQRQSHIHMDKLEPQNFRKRQHSARSIATNYVNRIAENIPGQSQRQLVQKRRVRELER